MPIMNGLAMMESLKKESTPAKIVMLSGYNDFEYAQIALQNGAVDYLLKPVTQESLTTAMQRVKSMIAEEQKINQCHARLDQEISSIRQQLLRRLVLEEIANLSEIKAKIKMLKLTLEMQEQIAVSIQLDQRFVLEKLYSPEKMQEYQSAYNQGLKQCLLETDIFTRFSISIDIGIHCVLLHPIDPQLQPDAAPDASHDCCRRFLQFMEFFSDLSFSIGISDVCRDFHGISAAYQAASTYSGQKFLPALSSIASRDRNPFDEYRTEIQEVVRYIQANYFWDITVDSAAKALYISPYHLMHLLKKELGLTFNTCVTMIRISAAQKLLAAGDSNFSETAQIVGTRMLSILRSFSKIWSVSVVLYTVP